MFKDPLDLQPTGGVWPGLCASNSSDLMKQMSRRLFSSSNRNEKVLVILNDKFDPLLKYILLKIVFSGSLM